MNKNFLDNKSVYKENVEFWDKIIQSLLQTEYTFAKYIATDDGYGNEFYDGNPIYNFMIESLNKGVRIIQEEAEDAQNQFAAWVNTAKLPDGNDIDELVINLQLSKETCLLAVDQEQIKKVA